MSNLQSRRPKLYLLLSIQSPHWDFEIRGALQHSYVISNFSKSANYLHFLHLVRPLRIHWVDENEKTAREEIERIELEQSNLENFRPLHIPGLEVQYNGLWTMLDGKGLFKFNSFNGNN